MPKTTPGLAMGLKNNTVFLRLPQEEVMEIYGA